MKLLSKLFTLGFLFVTMPGLARDCDHKKCSVIGTYLGAYVGGATTAMQFNENGTVSATNDNVTLFGTWHCKGNNCFEFYVAGEKINEFFVVLTGIICFAADCKTAHADQVVYSRYEVSDSCLTNPPFLSAKFDLNLCRVDCKK